jgi:hypothetical protein
LFLDEAAPLFFQFNFIITFTQGESNSDDDEVEEDDDDKVKIRESDFEDSWIVPDGVEIPAEDSDSGDESPPKPVKPRRTTKSYSDEDSSPVKTSDTSESETESPFRPVKPKRTTEKPKPETRRIEKVQPDTKKFAPKTFLASLSSEISSPT